MKEIGGGYIWGDRGGGGWGRNLGGRGEGRGKGEKWGLGVWGVYILVDGEWMERVGGMGG